MRFVSSVLLGLLICLVAHAQAPGAPALALRELTVRPVWAEVGKTYDLQVRFISNVPAVATGELTGAASAGPEKYACNNHRLDFPALAVGPARTLHLVVTALDKTKVEQTVPVASPARPPAVPAGKLELTVSEPAGQDRAAMPLTAGVPLAKGALYDAAHTRLVAPAGPLPLQARAESRWEDGSIKWLLLDTQLDLKASQKLTLILEYGGRTASPPLAAPLQVTELSGRRGFVVDSGALRAILPQDGKPELRLTAGDTLLASLGSTLTDSNGTALDFTAEDVTIIERGGLRTTVRLAGHYAGGGRQHFMGALLVTLFAGQSYARVDHVFGNDLVHENMTAIKSLVLDVSGGAAPANVSVGVVGAGPVSLASGAAVVQQFDDKFAGAATGKRLAGWAKSSSLALAVKDFWQQYPKALSVTPTGLQVGICPAITPADLYANKPDEEKLYYYLRDGNYTYRRGLRKRHELWVGTAAAATEIIARAAATPTAVAPARYYQSVRAAGDIMAASGTGWTSYDQIMDDGVAAYAEGRERDREYGLMNWGDWWGERRLNWGNIEYDLQVGMLQQYLRSGDPRFFVVGEAASRHNTDIDTIHWAEAPTRLPDQRLEPFPGEIWVHCMGHTGGYYPRDYKDMSIYAVGYATNRGHMWTGGNFLYGMLSGDPLVLESARLAADWMSGPNTTGFDFGNAREPGWMTIAVMSAYCATRDPYYLNAADIMLTKVHEKAQATRPEYGLYYHKLPNGHCNCPEDQKHYGEAGFMAGVLMTGMKRFYQETGREQVADDIVGIAKFIVDTMWEPAENGFRYTSCPKTGVAAGSGGIMDEGLAFAANRTNDEHLRQIVRLSFAGAMISLQSTASGGKSAGYLIHSMPGAITEISKFPGPAFDAFYAQQLREARSPALATLPTLMPNPDFEEGAAGWVTRTGFTVEPATEAAHSGKLGALVTGTGKAQNEYLVTRYSCGPPWEIMSLEPGRQYRLSAWIKVVEITPGTPPVSLRCAIRDKAQTRTAFTTDAYDDTKPGTWQRLSCQFEAPDYTNSAYVAVNMNTREPVTIKLYADDINLTSVASPDVPTYSYPCALVEQGQLGGGLKLLRPPSGPPWQFAVPGGKQAAEAVVKLTVSEASDYRAWLRGRAADGPGSVTVTCDGKPAGTATVAEPCWQWLSAQTDGKPVVLSLQPGEHTLKLAWPAGSKLGVHKIVLSNDLNSR
ncbi:MAG: carbohydrate binding domain-containing protein [Armatimonadetes bacterium]|nr:carbohydrate binding domain-containing protein [Armatimonadota bacterium]